jgi:hypothetical protein
MPAESYYKVLTTALDDFNKYVIESQHDEDYWEIGEHEWSYGAPFVYKSKVHSSAI